MIDARRSLTAALAGMLGAALLLTGCAPMTYNRYQTAQTLGAGRMKLMAAANAAHDPVFQVYPDLESDMNDEMREWAIDNGLDYDIEDLFADVFVDMALLMIYLPTMGLSPDLELLYAVGVTDRVDLEARLTASLYGRLNAKVLLADLGGDWALSVSPGLGYRPIHGHDSETALGGQGDAVDSYGGWALSAELPLLIGRQGRHVSPYFAPCYVYHYASLDYTRRTSGLDPEFERTLEYELSFHQVGLIAGAQFKWGGFVITPELAGLYHGGPGISYFMLYPGLALGASW